MKFHFRRRFRLRPNMKNAFRSASSIHHKKVLVLRCKVLVLVLNTRLGLGLGLEINDLGWKNRTTRYNIAGFGELAADD